METSGTTKDLAACVQALETFSQGGLKLRLRNIENQLEGGGAEVCVSLNSSLGIGTNLLEAAASVKRAAAQIDVMIHSIGILHLLPIILDPGEKVHYLSLGAGNTGKKFDLETDRQVAEFTFIAWRGGSEAIRQSKLFADFVHLAESSTHKERNLYVLGLHHPTKFFESHRTLASVLSRRPDELKMTGDIYEGRFNVVKEYCGYHFGKVNLIDMAPDLPDSLLAAVELAPEIEINV